MSGLLCDAGSLEVKLKQMRQAEEAKARSTAYQNARLKNVASSAHTVAYERCVGDLDACVRQ